MENCQNCKETCINELMMQNVFLIKGTQKVLFNKKNTFNQHLICLLLEDWLHINIRSLESLLENISMTNTNELDPTIR